MPSIKKNCSKCKEDRPITDFHKDKYNQDGLTHACKWCRGSKSHVYFRSHDHPICRTCGEVKTREDFHKRSNRKSGLSHRCKSCVKEYKKQPNVKKRNKYVGWKSKLHAKYNITPDDYFKMYDEQKGVCKICSTPEPCTSGTKSRFSVDHNHETGKVRGLLCNLCNRGLGFFYDNANLLRKAAKYLEENSR